MCSFFSFISKGDGKFLYADEKLRKNKEFKDKNFDPDSHTSLAVWFDPAHNPRACDKVNKYEFHNNQFIIDKINVKDDSAYAHAWVVKFSKTKKFKKMSGPLVTPDSAKPLKRKFNIPLPSSHRLNDFNEYLTKVMGNKRNRLAYFTVACGVSLGLGLWNNTAKQTKLDSKVIAKVQQVYQEISDSKEYKYYTSLREEMSKAGYYKLPKDTIIPDFVKNDTNQDALEVFTQLVTIPPGPMTLAIKDIVNPKVESFVHLLEVTETIMKLAYNIKNNITDLLL
jgi:hypothetical protein